MKALTVLGSTGSIGTQALDVVRRGGYRVIGLTAGSNIDKLENQAREFRPSLVAVADTACASELKNRLFGTGIEVCGGDDGICRVASENEAEITLNAIVGIAGLRPTLASLKKGRRLALANKETLVTAGHLVMDAVASAGAELIPVDSEHSAIFQSLHSGRPSEIRRILLTASGGPFFGKSREELESVRPEQALCHPNWSMGQKITIDSATMMNKGLEVIEAVHLFGVTPDQVKVLIHRQSIFHSAVEFRDGAVIAQLGTPDMKLPIAYALTYPERASSPETPLDLISVGSLTFAEPDNETFPCLVTCVDAIRAGGLKPAAANGANEAAVALYLKGKINFNQIGDLVKAAVHAQTNVSSYTVEDVFSADAAARRFVTDSVLDR